MRACCAKNKQFSQCRGRGGQRGGTTRTHQVRCDPDGPAPPEPDLNAEEDEDAEDAYVLFE